ncbi:MAG: SEC-C domain-containing protein [Nitrospinae bacterium]|nr:SEC-C domain-containing protein [Nitrospinota bacterium]
MINQIIKFRAKRFIAAEKKEWLYPEKNINLSWTDLGKSLLPPIDELHHYGGEIYVGYKDGTSSYHDQYGRTEKEADYLNKAPRKGKVGANEPCVCGSGKKYKKCCRDKAEDEKPSSSVLSIRERNLRFFHIITKILNINEDSDWNNIRRNLTDEKIADIHRAVAMLWPSETDLMSLLPRPDSKVVRALYIGILDPRVIYKNVVSFSLFADEILIQSPFLNANIMNKDYSPIDNPGQYRQETIKNLTFLIELMPLIESGQVNLIPDPCIFNPVLRRQVMEEAEKRLGKVELDEKSKEAMETLVKEDFERFILSLPTENLEACIKHVRPGISDKDLKNLLECVKKKN